MSAEIFHQGDQTREERREDPTNRLGINWHEPRAFSRFPRALGEGRREAITSAQSQFRNQGLYEGESERMREKLLSTLNHLEGKLTPEQLQLQELVRTHYKSELALYQEFGFTEVANPSGQDVPPPSLETVSQLLVTQLTPTQIAEILKQAKEPQFQMEALVPFERYVQALGRERKMPRQMDTYVNSKLRAAWARQDAAAGIKNHILGWNIGIMDAEQELEEDADLERNLGEKRTQSNKKLAASGLRLMHPRRYALAQMRALQQGKPLDAMNWSVLDDDTGDQSVVPGGGWSGDRVYFVEYRPGSRFANARFRREVVVRAA